jgi:membrane-anchored protein YejM (alkaline phosphatase superfamily)
VPSLFVWNADETRVRISKKHIVPDVIVAKQTPPGTVTIAEEHDDSQMTLLTGISAFGDSISRYSSAKQNFETKRRAEQQLFHRHD